MNLSKLEVPVVACVAASLLALGCAERVEVRANVPVPQAGVVVAEAPPTEVVVQQAPPPERVEVIPMAPVNSVWIRGHWAWDGGGWAWRPGHYEVRRMGLEWVPAHWRQSGPNIVWVRGYWKRI